MRLLLTFLAFSFARKQIFTIFAAVINKTKDS